MDVKVLRALIREWECRAEKLDKTKAVPEGVDGDAIISRENARANTLTQCAGELTALVDILGGEN